jgi:hypothetical protein
VGWIDTRVDAVEDLESMWRGKREASERAACDEGGVRRKTLLASVSRLVGRQPERTTSERGPAPSAHYRFARVAQAIWAQARRLLLVRCERLTGTFLTPASTRDAWRARTTPLRIVSAMTATLRGS